MNLLNYNKLGSLKLYYLLLNNSIGQKSLQAPQSLCLGFTWLKSECWLGGNYIWNLWGKNISKTIQMATRIHFHDVLRQRFLFSYLLLSMGYSQLLEDIQIFCHMSYVPCHHLQASHNMSNSSHVLILCHFPFPVTTENSLLLLGSPYWLRSNETIFLS